MEVVLLDAAECGIERPKRHQKQYYSGKKRHTLKIQIIANKDNLDVICIAFAEGKVHDFQL